MKAIIIGGGPVACLVAIELRKRSFEVHAYEKSADPRLPQLTRGHSFNLTLTRRGLSTLDDNLRELLYARGVRLPQRVIHHVDGSRSYQAYGTLPEHHLLSIPRGSLHQIFLDEAERQGARFFFDHECIRTKVKQPHAMFAIGNTIVEDTADILIGCDGANSIVRHEMTRQGARLNISQEYISHGYIELPMPPTAANEHSLLTAFRDPAAPESAHHGLHIWPRGDFMLLAQPNIDKTYTASLFMPFASREPDEPAFQHLRTPDDVMLLFRRYFPDVIELLPQLTSGFFAARPASLKTIKCYPYHYGRTVLFGDAAHTMVPFYGQGINCSFEDVRSFFSLFDRNLRAMELDSGIRRTLVGFTATRKAPGDAIADLSLANLRELSLQTGERTFQSRSRIERQLHLHHADVFTPLYSMVAFSSIPYDEVLKKNMLQRQRLDALCQIYDVNVESDQIISAYVSLARTSSVSRNTEPHGAYDEAHAAHD